MKTTQKMNQAELFRDEALERVEINSGTWFERAMVALRTVEGNLIGEEIRLRIEPIVGSPHHHNTYGALISQAVKKRYITPTGVHRKMKTARSHARKSPEYRCGSL